MHLFIFVFSTERQCHILVSRKWQWKKNMNIKFRRNITVNTEDSFLFWNLHFFLKLTKTISINASEEFFFFIIVLNSFLYKFLKNIFYFLRSNMPHKFKLHIKSNESLQCFHSGYCLLLLLLLLTIVHLAKRKKFSQTPWFIYALCLLIWGHGSPLPEALEMGL